MLKPRTKGHGNAEWRLAGAALEKMISLSVYQIHMIGTYIKGHTFYFTYFTYLPKQWL